MKDTKTKKKQKDADPIVEFKSVTNLMEQQANVQCIQKASKTLEKQYKILSFEKPEILTIEVEKLLNTPLSWALVGGALFCPIRREWYQTLTREI